MSRFIRLPKSGNYVDARLVHRVEVIDGGDSLCQLLVGRAIPSLVVVHFLGDQVEAITCDSVAQARDIRDDIIRAIERVEVKPVPDPEVVTLTPGLFWGLDGLTLSQALYVLWERCDLSPDPFVKWVGARIFKRFADRAAYLDARTPEDFEDRDQAALDVVYQQAMGRGARDDDGK